MGLRPAVEVVVGGLVGAVWRVEGGRRARRVRAWSVVCVVDGMVEGLLGFFLKLFGRVTQCDFFFFSFF